MTRFQVMAIAQAIGRHENEVFGDTCLISNLTRIIREEYDALLYRHTDGLDALKQAESALIDVSNLIDQANEGRIYHDLQRKVDAVLGELQKEIRYAETPVEDRG